MQRGINMARARDMLLALPVDLHTEILPLERASGRVLARDIYAGIDSPPFDRSPFDGYAFRGEDTAGASGQNPVTLEITEEIPAGTMPGIDITSGRAAKILTGAPIPNGANATVKYEDTEFSEHCVTFSSPVAPYQNLALAGSDVKRGTLLAERGTLISPPLCGVFANQGIAQVEAFRRPCVAIISTGSELCDVGEERTGAQIYNSNFHTLSAYLTELGAECRSMGTVEDDPDAIAAKIAAALETSDMVITTGGASVGDYDWAVRSSEKLGAEVLFWKIDAKPGGSIMASVLGGKAILGLSGNPGAAVLGYFLIAQPYVKRLCGRLDLMPQELEVLLKKPINKNSPMLRVLRGYLEISDTRAYFVENEAQGNEAVSSLVRCDLLAMIPKGSPPLEAGTIIKAIRV